MKNFKKAFYQATLIIAIMIGFSSCMNDKPEDTKDVAEDHNEAKFDESGNEKDAEFLVNAAEINMEEISLGQLAQQKKGSSHVKELGKMMEDAHTKLLTDLISLAETKSISLPASQTEDVKESYKKLNVKSGNEFGKEYSSMMVNGHKKAIELFEKAATDCNDPDIKAWASATLPALRMHLDQSLTCQEQCSKM